MPDSFCGDQEHSGEDQVMLYYQMGSGEVAGASWAPEGGFTTYSGELVVVFTTLHTQYPKFNDAMKIKEEKF